MTLKTRVMSQPRLGFDLYRLVKYYLVGVDMQLTLFIVRRGSNIFRRVKMAQSKSTDVVEATALMGLP